MRLCNFCVLRVLESKQSWDGHHSSFSELKKSKEDRCLFCSTLCQDIESFAESLKGEGRKEEWPVYRWSIRTLARFRESLETVVVTFRPMPRTNVQGKDQRDGRNSVRGENEKPLPTRTFYLFPDDDLGPLPTVETLGKSTNPAISGGMQIKQWIQTCDATHEGCSKRRKAAAGAQTFIPTRLLDIGGPPHRPIKVIETRTSGIKGPYASLSHCWGLKAFIRLTTDNRRLYIEEGIPWELLTKNFQEAIEVARFIGVDYIWIDSLCIVQAGEDGDFLSEANLMHQVYRNSYCNIAIVDSQDSTGGLFRSRDPKDVVPMAYKAYGASSTFGQKTWRMVPGDLWEGELLQTFLYRRGWVFQERMLAPRILHFAKRQIFWDCPSMSACETLPAGLPQPMDGAAGPDRHWRGRLQEPEDSGHMPLAGANDDSLEYFWKIAVRKYTVCALTMGKDKLLAMWGIAKLVRDARRIEYGAGLWEENLEEQLAWRVADCVLEERPSESKDKYLARDIPSWSWASMDGAIEVQDRLTDEPHYTVQDHFHRPLAFDLVGVKHYAPSTEAQDRWPNQHRGMSDSVVELQKRYKEMEKQERKGRKDGHATGTSQRSTKSPERMSRDNQPTFHSTAIPIQGHVGRGHLRRNDEKKKWLLEIAGLGDVEIEAFPDLKPKPGNDVDERPYFVVLSAKKIILEGKRPWKVEGDQFVENDESDQDDDVDQKANLVYSGVGILLKAVKNRRRHYRRTGALNFRNINEDGWRMLQKTYNGEQLSSDMYDSVKGLRFWLE
ncbi:HET-domain-containing protein [Zopfia rhizophila CBS 207.26]|uniref:HET-domain-containing protein n=1 Tax=Zopfia rhizophila CBS 207.26 TaxID=1314779 RepID=A0A6A6E4M5_9PEZI|nr:HET-domain-containing protein [Zopfia rhizophila CBS 207.26]